MISVDSLKREYIGSRVSFNILEPVPEVSQSVNKSKRSPVYIACMLYHRSVDSKRHRTVSDSSVWCCSHRGLLFAKQRV